jgi:hypothetical protein
MQHDFFTDAESEATNSPEGSLYATLDWEDPIPEFPIHEREGGLVEALFAVRDDWLSRLKILRCGDPSASFYPSDDAIERFTRRLLDCQRNDTAPDLKRGSWAIPADVNMEGDARVDFVYFPTYIVLAWLSLLWQERPDIAVRIPAFQRGLRGADRFSALRRLRGHGYEANEQCLEAVRVLALGKVFTLARSDSNRLPKIAALLPQLEESITVGMPNASMWSTTDPGERAYAIELIRGRDATDAWVVPTVHREWLDHQRAWFHRRVVEAVTPSTARAFLDAAQEEFVACTAEWRTIFDAEKPQYTVFSSRRGIRTSPIPLATELGLVGLVRAARGDVPPVEWLAQEDAFDTFKAIRGELEKALKRELQRELDRRKAFDGEEFRPCVHEVGIASGGTLTISVGVAG